MKRSLTIVALLVGVLFAKAGHTQTTKLTSKELYDRLANLDSVLFATVYTCNPDKARFFTDDLEFYHDKGGVTRTRKTFVETLERNFCGEQKPKLRRELVKGSLKVYPLNNYGAVQIGDHRFYVTENNQPERLSGIAKFVHIWQLKDGEWKLSRAFSFDHREIGSTQPAASIELYNSIAHADSLLFAAYNAHDLKKLQAGFTFDLEFYHDKDGLSNYVQVGEGFKSVFNQNNGIKRELVNGSLEVYPITDFGAVEIGSHQFCHKENGKDDCGTFAFIMLWIKQDATWKISRVISYDH